MGPFPPTPPPPLYVRKRSSAATWRGLCKSQAAEGRECGRTHWDFAPHHVACITRYQGTRPGKVVGGLSWRVVASGGYADVPSPCPMEKGCESRFPRKRGRLLPGCKARMQIGQVFVSWRNATTQGVLLWLHHFRRKRRDGFPGNWPDANLTPSKACRVTGKPFPPPTFLGVLARLL